ncbi:MAG: GntR family transcriptional regulator [Acidothermaceae bacterium]
MTCQPEAERRGCLDSEIPAKDTLEFRIERDSGTSPYLQLVTQVKEAMRFGRLRPGDRLPPASDAAARACVDRNTVLRAYHELALEGLAIIRPRHGTYVARLLTDPTSRDQAALSLRLERWVMAARRAGLDDDGIVSELRLALRRATTTRLRSGADA